jgi:hypothetical protein
VFVINAIKRRKETDKTYTKIWFDHDLLLTFRCNDVHKHDINMILLFIVLLFIVFYLFFFFHLMCNHSDTSKAADVVWESVAWTCDEHEVLGNAKLS